MSGNPSDFDEAPRQNGGKSFAETALELGGKSAEESRRTGVIDQADDQVEALFAPQYQTVNSPAHRAVWEKQPPYELFTSRTVIIPDGVKTVMEESIRVVGKHRKDGSLYDQHDKISETVFKSLADVGYWGLLVDSQYGGSGSSFSAFAQFLTTMATHEPTIAGLASVHGCIGAVDPVRTFGTAEQKEQYLPALASGSKLSAFALTEPCAGSDLTALRTRAELRGSHYHVTGEKLFITNVVPGRTIGLVCLIEEKPAVLIVDLPLEESDSFHLKKYGLYALRRAFNQGIVFNDFKVPVENLLRPAKGDGLTIAYHGLNLGRVALCATAAGTLRMMMANMIPWAQFRTTYGQRIASRELIQRRLGRIAGMIVACDAMVAWCSGLIDQGYRGEMECIIAKILGSELQKEAAIELLMKTHGGRSFLQGHLFGDNVHEYLAPCIYEGEGEMLGMAFFKSLVKNHGTQFFEPIGRALQSAGIRKPRLTNPSHVWALKSVMGPYAYWMLCEKMKMGRGMHLPKMPLALQGHAKFAAASLQKMPSTISGTMRKHQLALADRQCRMADFIRKYSEVYSLFYVPASTRPATDDAVRSTGGGFVLSGDSKSNRGEGHPDDAYFPRCDNLGERQWLIVVFLHSPVWKRDEILMPYKNT